MMSTKTVVDRKIYRYEFYTTIKERIYTLGEFLWEILKKWNRHIKPLQKY
jgi:hypothetical protein